MKKVLALIIAPLMAVGMLLGCKRVEFKAEHAQTAFATFMDSYITGAGSNVKNEVFYYNLQKTGADADETDEIIVDEVAIKTHEKIMQISYSTELATRIKTPSKENFALNQLSNTYQTLLSLIFNYYSNWNVNFYTVIGDTEMTKKEYEKLYDAVVELEEETNNFLNKKSEIELQYRYNGMVALNQEIKNFNTAYNGLIVKSLNFVNLFKDYHKKYIFNNTAVLTINNARQLVDETLLAVAEGVFYDNVLSLQKNGSTDLTGYSLEDKSQELAAQMEPFSWIVSEQWEALTSVTAGSNAPLLLANNNLNVQISEETAQTIEEVVLNLEADPALRLEAQTRINTLRIYLNSFKQDLKNYKQIFKTVNLTNYNSYRQLVEASTKFNFEEWPLKERVNIIFMLNFSSERINNLILALGQIVTL